MTEAAPQSQRLPLGSIGHRASGWWAMLTLVLTEGALFAYLLFSYYYFAVQYGRTWLPPTLPSFLFSVPNTILLILSGVALWWAERSIRRGSQGQLALGVLLGFVFAAIFVALQFVEWMSASYTIASSSYASLYFTITGFHVAHVIAGLIILAALLAWSVLRYFDAERHVPVSIGALYFYFVAIVWIAIFFTLYITPYLG